MIYQFSPTSYKVEVPDSFVELWEKYKDNFGEEKQFIQTSSKIVPYQSHNFTFKNIKEPYFYHFKISFYYSMKNGVWTIDNQIHCFSYIWDGSDINPLLNEFIPFDEVTDEVFETIINYCNTFENNNGEDLFYKKIDLNKKIVKLSKDF